MYHYICIMLKFQYKSLLLLSFKISFLYLLRKLTWSILNASYKMTDIFWTANSVSLIIKWATCMSKTWQKVRSVIWTNAFTYQIQMQLLKVICKTKALSICYDNNVKCLLNMLSRNNIYENKIQEFRNSMRANELFWLQATAIFTNMLNEDKTRNFSALSFLQ